MYKKKLKDWGVRKNIKADEALEVASGHNDKSIEFWPESRRSDYGLRIARHLKRCKHGKSIREQSCDICRALRDGFVASLGTTPAYTTSALANVEMGLYAARIYFETASPAKLVQWTYTPAHIALRNEKFMKLFDQSVKDLARSAATKQSFTNINRAFDMLQGLMKEDHPSVYHTMVNSMALCKSYPSSEICFRVCQMFAKYCQQLALVVLGVAHPINPCFTADIGMVESGDPGDLTLFLRGSTDMCIQYGAVYKPGMEPPPSRRNFFIEWSAEAKDSMESLSTSESVVPRALEYRGNKLEISFKSPNLDTDEESLAGLLEFDGILTSDEKNNENVDGDHKEASII